MTVTYRCTQCGGTTRAALPSSELVCEDGCKATLQAMDDSVVGSQVVRCVVCPSKELFIRKDFPQRLGVTIIAVGMSLSCVTWFFNEVIWTYAILFATALIDLGLYIFMGDVLECYRCHAQYRGVELVDHDAFDLETHERYRQQDARLQQAQQSVQQPESE